MKSPLLATACFLLLLGVVGAAPLPLTPFTVIARVDSFEHYRALGGAQRFSAATPHGNDDTIVATLVWPDSVAGREVAIPFESRKDGKELLVQPGTIFRFENRLGLTDLRSRTDNVRRRAIGFPELGVFALKSNGEVAEAYEGSLTALVLAEGKAKAAGH